MEHEREPGITSEYEAREERSRMTQPTINNLSDLLRKFDLKSWQLGRYKKSIYSGDGCELCLCVQSLDGRWYDADDNWARLNEATAFSIKANFDMEGSGEDMECAMETKPFVFPASEQQVDESVKFLTEYIEDYASQSRQYFS